MPLSYSACVPLVFRWPKNDGDQFGVERVISHARVPRPITKPGDHDLKVSRRPAPGHGSAAARRRPMACANGPPFPPLATVCPGCAVDGPVKMLGACKGSNKQALASAFPRGLAALAGG